MSTFTVIVRQSMCHKCYTRYNNIDIPVTVTHTNISSNAMGIRVSYSKLTCPNCNTSSIQPKLTPQILSN